MKRVGVLVVAGVMVVGGTLAAAARWAPGTLQPAGTRAELARWVVQAVDEVDAMLGEEVEPSQLAADDEIEAAPAVVDDPMPVQYVPSTKVCMELVPPEVRVPGEHDCRLQVVVFRSGEAWRAESKWMKRELFKKS